MAFLPQPACFELTCLHCSGSLETLLPLSVDSAECFDVELVSESYFSPQLPPFQDCKLLLLRLNAHHLITVTEGTEGLLLASISWIYSGSGT